MTGRSAGEALFSAYLRQRQLSFEYEPAMGTRHPDFLVRHPAGDIVCEVYEPEGPQSPTGWIDPCEHMVGAFSTRKRKQGAEAKRRRLPYVIVLANTNSRIQFDALAVTGTMFGKPGVAMPLDSERGIADLELLRQVFGEGGGLNRSKNTRYSAFAVVSRFNPTLHRVQRAYLAKIERHRIPLGARPEVIIRAFDEAEQSGVYEEGARLARLTIYHNPFAATRLSLRSFGGPHDEQWDAVDGSGLDDYELVVQGPRCWELPV